MTVASDYAYLCCNCGAINRYTDWTFLKHDHETGALVPVEPGDTDPVCVCPGCGFAHEDDDSGPGVYDGTIDEMTAERERLAADPVFADLWAERSGT